jgi:hypothetical protein
VYVWASGFVLGTPTSSPVQGRRVPAAVREGDASSPGLDRVSRVDRGKRRRGEASEVLGGVSGLESVCRKVFGACVGAGRSRCARWRRRWRRRRRWRGGVHAGRSGASCVAADVWDAVCVDEADDDSAVATIYVSESASGASPRLPDDHSSDTGIGKVRPRLRPRWCPGCGLRCSNLRRSCSNARTGALSCRALWIRVTTAS